MINVQLVERDRPSGVEYDSIRVEHLHISSGSVQILQGCISSVVPSIAWCLKVLGTLNALDKPHGIS